MFSGFNIKKYLEKKPPNDDSFQTTQEIKELNKIPINKRFVQEKDDIKGSFVRFAKKKGINVDAKELDKVIEESAKVILKIKKHHNRPRPKVLAKKNNIKLDDKELDSMKTPSYPSGHSAQGVLIAKLLADKYPTHAKELIKTGKDISYSRNVAHAHYKSDSSVGEQLGKDLYEHVKSDSPLKCWSGYKRVPGTAKGSKGSCKKASPVKNKVKAKGGGTTKVCLPKAKIASMSSSEKQSVVSAKRKAGKAGKYKRSSKSNVTGTSSGGDLRTWVKQDWRQVGNPSKKCGEK